MTKENCLALFAVNLEDVDSVRHGRQTEGLKKYTEPSMEDRCFSVIFKGRRKNLDLLASSKDEAKQWVRGFEKVINGMNNLNRQQNSEQYPHNRVLVLSVLLVVYMYKKDFRITLICEKH